MHIDQHIIETDVCMRVDQLGWMLEEGEGGSYGIEEVLQVAEVWDGMGWEGRL